MVQFREAYIFSILYALAMTDLLPETPDFALHYDLTTPDAKLALILMAQLNENNMKLIVLGLLKRLHEPSMSGNWEARVDLLDLIVQCAGFNFGKLTQNLQVKIIQELCCCILHRQDESRFKKWLAEQSISGIPGPIEKMNLNGKRIRSSELRPLVLEVLAATKAPQAFEILRWFVMEPLQAGDPTGRMADTKMRQKALQLLRERWQLAQKQNDSPFLKFLGNEAYQELGLLLETWAKARQQTDPTDMAGFNLLTEWMLDEKVRWRSSITAVTLSDLGARIPAWTEKATTTLVNHFQNSTDENAIELISESLTLLSYLPADNVELQRIKQTMMDIAGQKPAEPDYEIKRLRQETAAATLGRLKVESALDTLVAILGDKGQDFKVRARAAWSIGKIGAEYPQHTRYGAAREALMEAARSDFGWPQQEAIKALGICSPDKASEELLKEIRAALEEGSPSNQEKYVIGLINQTIPKCGIKSEPGYSISPTQPGYAYGGAR
jgi:hypothetical protein